LLRFPAIRGIHFTIDAREHFPLPANSMLKFQPPGFVSRSLELPQGALVYYTQGGAPWPLDRLTQAPILLFLHSLGGGSSAFEWSKVYGGLAHQYQIIAPDLIGWGASEHPAIDYQLEDYLQILRDLLGALELQFSQRPVCIIASSSTAAMMLRLATANEPRSTFCDRFFLVSPSGYRDFGEDYRQGLGALLASTPLLDRFIYSVGAANEFAIQNFLSQFLFANPQRITEEIIQAYLASALQPNAEYAALAALKGNLFFDLSETLDRLTTPTTLVWGAQAKFSSPTVGRRLQQLNPQAIKQFYEIPDSGVLCHLEQPATIIALLGSVLTDPSGLPQKNGLNLY
jgi:pimeloyl-ACP methyl ester carboxylesterase